MGLIFYSQHQKLTYSGGKDRELHTLLEEQWITFIKVIHKYTLKFRMCIPLSLEIWTLRPYKNKNKGL